MLPCCGQPVPSRRRNDQGYSPSRQIPPCTQRSPGPVHLAPPRTSRRGRSPVPGQPVERLRSGCSRVWPTVDTRGIADHGLRRCDAGSGAQSHSVPITLTVMNFFRQLLSGHTFGTLGPWGKTQNRQRTAGALSPHNRPFSVQRACCGQAGSIRWSRKRRGQCSVVLSSRPLGNVSETWHRDRRHPLPPAFWVQAAQFFRSDGGRELLPYSSVDPLCLKI